jgi:glycosyltransferase involved in cell wall biosynthesis
MRNEEKYLHRLLDSILANDYPPEKVEIIIVDDASEDASCDIVQEYAVQNRCIRLVRLEERVPIPVVLNTALRCSGGDYIIRMDAHARYAPDYIRTCVRLLAETGATNVGGTMRAVGEGVVGRAVALAATNPFGVGDAYFRYLREVTSVDTVFPGAWSRATLTSLGGFSEEWSVNEDYELNCRIRESGGWILLSPEIQYEYFVRSSFRRLARQYVRNGFWRVKTLRRHPGSLRSRQLIPALFVAALAFSVGIAPFCWPAAVVIPAAHALVNLVASVRATKGTDAKLLPFLLLAFTTIHVSWGVGFWAGMLRFGVPRIRLATLLGAFKKPKRLAS